MIAWKGRKEWPEGGGADPEEPIYLMLRSEAPKLSELADHLLRGKVDVLEVGNGFFKKTIFL